MNKSVRDSVAKMHGAVLYTRVSTGEQEKHGTSPETQRDACRAKALSLGLPIVAEYHDGGISGGFLLARAGFQAALADIRAGRADTLICASLSRYSRDVEHQQAVKKAVRAAGGHLVFCDMEFADTPEGDLNFTIQGSFAEYERRAIEERLRKGRWARAGQGQQPSRARPPMGYRIVSKAQVDCGLYPPEMVGRYIIDEDRAPLIRELFARYASGKVGMPALCRDLNARSVPTPRSASLWRSATLRAILTNPVYKGQPAYGRTITRTDEVRLTETHKLTGRLLTTPRYRQDAPDGRAVVLSAPPLVSEEEWDAAQRRMAENRTNLSGNPRRVRMLSGRVFCPCGHAALLVCAQFRSTDYYRCSNSRNLKEWEGKRGCPSAYYRVEISERAVAAAFLSAAQNPAALADARRLYAKKLHEEKLNEEKLCAEQAAGQSETLPIGTDARREMAAIDGALEKLSERQLATAQAQVAGLMVGAETAPYLSLLADIAAERKDLEDRRGQIAKSLRALKQTDPTKEKGSAASRRESGAGSDTETDLALQALNDAALVLSSPDVPGETKRAIIGMVVSRVVCQRDGAEIYFLPGFAPFAGLGAGEESADGETASDTLQNAEEFWYILRGAGRFHRLSPDGGAEETAEVSPGDALLIPTGYRF